VRNSIRRSTRMSHAGRRFSTATTASTTSSRDKDFPPVPPVADMWKDSASISSGTLTPPRLAPGLRTPRPSSIRRGVISATYANSIVESLAEEEDDEEEEDDAKSDWSVVKGEETLRPHIDTGTIISSTNSEKDDEDIKSDEEDSEEEYEEGEFDAVGGGPTRWIRGALIGMGSFGSVYLGMNRASGELMAVKQVELPSHDVQGVQRKQSMLVALQREISLLRDLTHENIVHYIGISL
jgi:mitogen-activated protein kinase kinase kinase